MMICRTIVRSAVRTCEKGFDLKVGLAKMLVRRRRSWTSRTPSRRVIAEDAGAVAVMALERVPADDPQRGWRRAR